MYQALRLLLCLLSGCILWSQCTTTGTIQGPYILPVAEVGIDYSYQFQLVAGPAMPHRFFLYITSRLPDGLEITERGELVGRPTRVATENPFAVLARGPDFAFFAYCEFKISVIANRLAITSSDLPTARVGAPYSASINVVNGVTPYRFELISGTYPPGTLVFSNGTISGTPTTAGSYTMRIRVTDNNGNRQEADIRIRVESSGLSFLSSSLPTGEVGTPYTASIRTSAPSTIQRQSGALPAGLTLSSAGELTGTPLLQGAYSFTLRATSGSTTTDGAFTLTINPSSRVLGLDPLPNTRFPLGLPLSQQLPAVGGSPPYRFSLLEGVLPAGLTVSADGLFTGIPRRVGGYDHRWRVTDATGVTAERVYRLTIDAPLALPDAISGQRYTHRDSTFTALAPNAKLPLGLRLDPDGTLTGTPFAAGLYQFAVRAGSTTQSLQLRVVPPPSELAIETIDLPAAQRSRPYRQSFFAASPIDRINVIDGQLPPGLSLTASTIEGSPTQDGFFEFLLDLRSGSRSTSRRYAINVAPFGPSVLDAVVSSASYRAGAASPGEIITLFGESLDGARLRVNGIAAPLLYVLPRQASFVLPFGISSEVELWLERNGMESFPFRLPIVDTRPALYSRDGSGQGPAAALYPAPRIVVLFGTGLGRYNTAVTDGAAASAALPASVFSRGDLRAMINGNLPARILYAGAAPGLLFGVFQVNVELPEGLPPGRHKLQLMTPSSTSLEVEIDN